MEIFTCCKGTRLMGRGVSELGAKRVGLDPPLNSHAPGNSTPSCHIILLFEMSSRGTESPAECSESGNNIPGLRDSERKKAAGIIQVHFQQPARSLAAEPIHRRTTEGIVLVGN